jgi:3-phosphoshikimate 1-carboxyvinyltransferase
MSSIEIFPGALSGEFTLPSSKSHTLRAFIFALMANGTSSIHNPLISNDAKTMLRACEQLGAKYLFEHNTCHITGVAGVLKPSDDIIDCGNSGIVFRFLSALASLLNCYTIFSGDTSMRYQRPIEPLLLALRQCGVFAESARNNGCAPVIIKGPVQRTRTCVLGEDSQFVSALLVLGAFTESGLEIIVESPCELPWIDLTCYWLRLLDIKFERSGYTYFKVYPKNPLSPFSYDVPGDLSSAAFSIVGALITDSTIKIKNIDLEDAQGDKHVLTLLEKMGAKFVFEKATKTLSVLPSSELCGIDIDMDQCIDALPILAVAGCFAKGKTRLYNAKAAKFKESNRIDSIAIELKKMGATIDVCEDGLTIHNSSLHSAFLRTYQDHRMVMALAAACLKAKSSCIIDDISATHKSYPEFFSDMKRLGMNYRLCH